MGRIENLFQGLRKRGEKALVAYFTAGYPCLRSTPWILREAVEAGVDILEVGIPFSDPTADGPVIHSASKSAIEAGTTLEVVMDMVASMRKEVDIPIVLFTYYNPVLAFGVERFFQKAREAQLDGLLIVDLPPEEASELEPHIKFNGIRLIRLVAPNTPPRRLKRILRGAQGFIYSISSTSVTGTISPDLQEVREQVGRIRDLCGLPVVVGFGISTVEEASRLASFCDGIVVGSALMRILGECNDWRIGAKCIAHFLEDMKRALRNSQP